MTDDIVIRANELSKRYKLFNSEKERLFEWVTLGRVRRSHDHWALHDITFDVRRGEFIGIIGRNGSGKTTLLKILSSVIEPTAGTFEIEGNVVSLLELGTGFNPELAGRQNVLHSSQLLGFEAEYIKSIMHDVETFADIGDYFDQPVKIYSSGMYVRLAMSVFFHMKPDILIVDEALSVGDIFFQQKCMHRMRELREQGVTLLFVSHDMAIVRDLCERVMYLKQGRMMFYGSSPEAIRLYFQEGSTSISSSEYQKPAPRTVSSSDIICNFKQNAVWVRNDQDDSEGLKARILAVSVLDSYDEPTMKAKIGDEIKVRVLYQTFVEELVHVHLILKNRFDQIIFSGGSYSKETPMISPQHGEWAVFELQIACMIEAGPYTFSLTLGQMEGLPNRGGANLDATPWIGPLTIEWDYENQKAPFLGMFGIPTTIKFIRVEEVAKNDQRR